MVEEYHDECLHVMVDCKTGNRDIDKAVEMSIKGYINLVVYSLKTGKFGELLDKVQHIGEEFKKQHKK